MVKPFFRPFLRLQWKLTFSYMWITVTTLVILTLAGIIAGSEAAAANFSQLVVGALKAHASELVPYLSTTPPDQAGVERWLQQPENLTAQVVLSNFPRATFSVTMDGFTVVVDQQGVVVASRGSDAASAGTLLEQQLPRQATAALEEKGLVAAVREFASQWSLQSGIATHVRVQGDFSPSVLVAETMFRIIQEALANVARHSQATTVEITLTSEQDTFKLSVNDNGQGFEHATAQGKGVGLLSMQERMHSFKTLPPASFSTFLSTKGGLSRSSQQQ